MHGQQWKVHTLPLIDLVSFLCCCHVHQHVTASNPISLVLKCQELARGRMDLKTEPQGQISKMNTRASPPEHSSGRHTGTATFRPVRMFCCLSHEQLIVRKYMYITYELIAGVICTYLCKVFRRAAPRLKICLQINRCSMCMNSSCEDFYSNRLGRQERDTTMIIKINNCCNIHSDVCCFVGSVYVVCCIEDKLRVFDELCVKSIVDEALCVCTQLDKGNFDRCQRCLLTVSGRPEIPFCMYKSCRPLWWFQPP